MEQKNFQELIKSGHEKYKGIGHVECPAFRGEKVYFNKHGLRHLVRKDKKIRSIYEQARRFKLLSYAAFVLKESSQFQSKKVGLSVNRADYFWTFAKTVNSIKIRVIVRQLGNGRKHFFSIMEED